MPEFTVFKGSKERKILKSTTTKEVGDDDVLIKVTHSGLCGTDEHHKGMDMVLGHEGAGTVEQVGASVKTLQKGDSVGWGYQQNSCGHCKQCLTGRETLCPSRELYGSANFDQGSFATYAIWKADYVFKIPDSIPREFAAPLMCGGATSYGCLRTAGVKSTDRVGIIGIGGVGHLAIQFAAKMGCQVVVFSGTDSKKDEAKRLGASEFIATKNVEKLETAPIDHLIVTTSFQPDWKQYLPIMAPGGTILPLTVSGDDLRMPYMPLVLNELKVQGSLVAARQVHREMLEFAAFHGITPTIETFPMTVEGIEEGMKKLADGKMRYRGVVVVE
ncbi:hypothetical protein B7494_g1461 [Chlorociboria aeruginascens]|nr:hypothetical protein B7494_g1461 [Chlorociboria aeruginascens]